jgi:hypothetical protein
MIIAPELTDSEQVLMPATATGRRKTAPAPGLFAVPPEDLSVFGALSFASRKIVEERLDLMRFIADAKTAEAGMREIRIRFGHPVNTLRRWWFAFKAEGWRVLVPCNKEGCKRASLWGAKPEKTCPPLSPAVKEWFIALAERNQRKTRPAWRQFKKQWLAGAVIPTDANGKCTDPEFNALSRHALPAGCSYANLQRFAADKFALEAMRVGLGSARAKHGPKTFSTRVGLWPMSHVQIDDLWHDNFVTYRGELCRVLEFDAIDVLSACKIGWGTKPRTQRDNGSFEGLPEKFVRMLLAQIFFQFGYSPRGTIILAEHGTAAVPDFIKRILFDRTGGKIQVREYGMTGKEQAVVGMFGGRGKGNPRFKSALESLRNLIHNELGALPAQTGLGVERRPEQLDGELKHNSDLLKAVAVLAQTKPERAELIRLSVLQYHSQFLPLLGDVYETINRRDWHELEGWHKCGFVVPQLNDAGNWVCPESLPVAKREALLGLAKVDKGYLRDARLSPRQVFNRGIEQLTKVPAFVVSEMLGPDFAREEKCANSYFEFQDGEIDPEVLRFESRISTPEGSEQELASDTYQVFVNPFDLNQLFVHDAAGRHLGIARRVVTPSKADDAGLRRQFGRNNQRLADLLKPIRARHAALTRQATNDAKHNARVIAEAGLGTANSQPPTANTQVADCTQEILAREDDAPQPEDWE